MAVISNRSYVDKFNCARLYCCFAYDDADLFKIIVADVFSNYDKELFVSFRKDIPIGDKSTGTDLSGDLLEAHAMLLIVSNNFLNQNDMDGSMAEFRTAVDNNIPILPIAVERDLEDKFNAKCGKLELIFKYNTSYPKVLRENLNRVFTDDKFKKKIRQNFYGNIFLSYRRLDLKYAKETMKYIHGIRRCEDVGIWYDGALVPGINYENEIFEQLEKCDIVLMIVTSRLLEPGNYIMNEYPRVKVSGTKILPYIVEDVDTSKLLNYYEGLLDEYPNGIRSKEELQSVLNEVYDEHENIWNAEHMYYIGMAWFYGIDFFVDIKAAIRYFDGAASNGCMPAVEKLVEIYEHGYGIDIDLQQAIKYQKRYFDETRRLEKIPCMEETIYTRAAFKLAQLYEREKQYDDAEKIYISVLNDFDLQPKYEQKISYYLSIAKIYERLGILAKTVKNYEQAKKNLIKAQYYVDNAERVAKDESERNYVRYEYARIAEDIVDAILELGNEADLHIASLQIQMSIKPYEEILYTEALDNPKKEILSRLYFKDAAIERKIFGEMIRNNENDITKLLEKLDWIIGTLKNSLELCTETDFNESIKNIYAYYDLTLILEELKNTYYIKFCLKPTSNNLTWYEGYLEQMMNIFMNVDKCEMSSKALMNKINECINMGEFFATRKYKDKAVDFYKKALVGMRKYGLSEKGKDIKTIKRIIKQLS